MSAEPVLVAVDFTADTLRLLFAEPDGEVVARERWPLPDVADDEAWAWEVGGRIATLFAREGERRSALAIAVAAPGSVDPLAGRMIRSAGQPQWEGLAIVEALRRHIDAPVATENRTVAALLGEQWQGAADGAGDVLYVSLRGVPAAALLVGGRPLRGARHEAGGMPAVPQFDAEAASSDDQMATVAGLLADATALFDPELVVLDVEPQHLQPLAPLLQRVVDEVAPGPRVVAAQLGEESALIGALRMASTLAYEGQRTK